MCGIAGIYDFSDGRVDHARLEAMRLALQHRGPDGSESVVLGHAGLVHTRLSILDLSTAAHQPMWDKDRRGCVTYNGEIYNFRDIRRQLELEGVSFRSTGDTEVLLMACLTFGVRKTLPLLNGMFAFAFWDDRTGELWLGRDRTGIKPLYYTQNNGQFLFASEIRALLAVTDRPKIDIPILINLIYGGTSTKPYTPFAGIYGLRTGHYLRLTRGKPDTTPHPYHLLTDDIDAGAYQEYRRMSGKDIAGQFYGLLEKSVEIHSISDAPVAALVSGGVDSAVIASYARQLSDKITFYHADVVGAQSELEPANAVARHLGSPLRVVQMRQEDYVRELVRTIYYHETPSAYHPNDVPFQMVANLAHQDGIKVFLTGEGADELFYGYGEMAWRYLEDRLLSTRLARLPLLGKMTERLRESLYLTGRTGFIEEISTRGLSHEIMKNAEEAYSFITDGVERRAKIFSLSYMSTHLNSLLMRNDRMGMMHSLESRIPFLENEIIRFALNLPMKHLFPYHLHEFLRGNPLSQNKAVVRAVAGRLLPKAISRRRKQGFPVTPLDYLKPCPGFYRDGFLAATFGYSEAELLRTLKILKPEQQWNFFATEVFGRLFFMGETIPQLEERVNASALT